MTNRTIKAHGRIVGKWHNSPAPIGFLPRKERFIKEYTIYSADYYRLGEKLYLEIRFILQGENCAGITTDFVSDGNEKSISEFCKHHNIFTA